MQQNNERVHIITDIEIVKAKLSLRAVDIINIHLNTPEESSKIQNA